MFRHARIIRDAQLAGVTIDDLALALASREGKSAEYDEAKRSGDLGLNYYSHFTIAAEVILERATVYARDRAQRGKLQSGA
jgi:hypothetical protein